MSVENSTVIDSIGIDAASERAVLTVVDHLPWNEDHLQTLQEKLNAYLRFVEYGEVFAVYPSAKGKGLSIEVVAKFRPTQEGIAFLEAAGQAIRSAGIEFKYGPSDCGYEGDD